MPKTTESSSTARVRRYRQRRSAAGLPDADAVRRLIVDTVAAYPEPARVKLLEAVARRVPADQRDGWQRAAKQLLRLTPAPADPNQLDLEKFIVTVTEPR